MDTSPESGSHSAAAAAEPEAKREKELVHKTKVIQFLGRTTPIILQNDNGPCPLLAICNVLSLKNLLNLSPDIPEISQEKLLSLVAEPLIDSNTNSDNKDTGFVENQLQNIADAIDLLPRLTTGIDVNLKFRRIDDFEFTPECAIFDLLDIPLYHGWIVDPEVLYDVQCSDNLYRKCEFLGCLVNVSIHALPDRETVDAIGSKSYNTLMAELVSLEAQSINREQKKNLEDGSVDFVAATTAALGIPSPSLSRGQSFDDYPQQARKGDIEEEAELFRLLRLSEVESSNTIADDVVFGSNIQESVSIKKHELVTQPETVEKSATEEPVKTVSLVSEDNNALENLHEDTVFTEVVSQEALASSTMDEQKFCVEPPDESRNIVDNAISLDIHALNNSWHKSMSCNQARDHVTSTSNTDKENISHNRSDGKNSTCSLKAADSDSSSGQVHCNDEAEAKPSCVDDSEPIYEGEDRISDSGTVVYENREPMYEGEVVLAEQGDTGCVDDGGFSSMDRISTKQGEIIRNFLKSSASQLTIYGLFCLQEQVKERELSVFFRNNHFNTMFKYEGELYILATDQGCINQPDLVWEKLNEVNGDTVYMTGNFKEFKMDDPSNSIWDEQNDYLAGIDSTQPNSSFNSDLQLAIALQQQEFDHQQQQDQPCQLNSQQPAISSSSGLVVGPQVPRTSGKYRSSSKLESKSKEKCIVM